MIIKKHELENINSDLTTGDIKAMEMAIFAYTNNHFHVANYRAKVHNISDKRLFVGLGHLFQPEDTVELVGVPIYEGFYHVMDKGDDWIEIDTELSFAMDDLSNGYVFLTVFPADVKAGVKKVWQYQTKADKKIGIKSESISRMSITYDKAESGQTVNGIPAYLFDFLEPYHKMRWS